MFSASIFNSRIKSANVSNGERWLGFFLGPAGAALLNTIFLSYLNVFYTDVIKIGWVWGGVFLAVFPIISKVIDSVTNLLMGQIIEKTKSPQGKARPWLLISAPLVCITSVLMFAVPNASSIIQVIWIMLSYNLFYSFAFTMYNMSSILMSPLSTRNVKQRDGLAMLSNMGTVMIPGMLITMIFPLALLPIMGVDQGKWLTVISIVSIFALPLILLQYFYTKERVTEDVRSSQNADAKVIPIGQQIKACVTNKYWLTIMFVLFLWQFYSNIQAVSLVYFCNWILGTYNDGITMTMVSVVGRFPLGVGVFLLWPFVKKFGKRKAITFGFLLAVVGLSICLINPHSMPVMLTGLFIHAFGVLATFTFMALMSDVIDYVEWKSGFRVDGLTGSIYTIIYTVSIGIATGIFNGGLNFFGYIAPSADGAWVAQNAATQSFIVAAQITIPIVAFVLIAALTWHANIDKIMPKIKVELTTRYKAEAKERGEVYISPEEKEKVEQEALDRVAEEKRVEELRERCEKKGLDFTVEETKYQKKLLAKASKKNKNNKQNGR
jgi:GPH family glycoside/pentoside/hexuronide:cation symporter